MAQNGQNGDWRGFVNIRLESQHKKAVKALRASIDGDWIEGKLLEFVSDGYQFSMSPDVENDAIICTLTGKTDDCTNCGFSLSQRHSDPLVALAALVFAHEEIAQRGIWEAVQYDWRNVDW